MRVFFTAFFSVLTLLSTTALFAQSNDFESINTLVAKLDPNSKTDVIFSTYEGNYQLSAKRLKEVIDTFIEENPHQKELNIVVATDKGRSRLLSLINKYQNYAHQKGLSITTIPFDTAAAALAAKRNQTTPSLNIEGINMALSRTDTPQDKNIRNTVTTTKDTLRTFYQDAKNIEFRGLITATVIAGAGGTVLGPSWIFATDVPVSYEITSAFVSAVLLYWLPRKTSSIASLYKLSYEYFRTARYLIPTILSKDYVVPPATKRGQTLSTAFTGGVTLAYSLQYILQGTAVGFESIGIPLALEPFARIMGFESALNHDYQMLLLWNSLMIGAASTPWSSFTHKLRKHTALSKEWIAAGRTAHILGVGLLAVNMPGLTESYMLGYSLNWAQTSLLMTGALGVIANYISVPIINKDATSIWFRMLNNGLNTLKEKSPDIIHRFKLNNFIDNINSRKAGMCGKYLS